MTVEQVFPPMGSVVARLARQVELALAIVGLSSAQYRVLMQLAHDEDAATSLARKLAVTAPSATNVVDGLVKRGAIERTHSVGDRRRISLELTEMGRELLSAADDAVQTKLEVIVDELNDKALAESALGALNLWGEALDRARMRLLARRTEASAAPC